MNHTQRANQLYLVLLNAAFIRNDSDEDIAGITYRWIESRKGEWSADSPKEFPLPRERARVRGKSAQ